MEDAAMNGMIKRIGIVGLTLVSLAMPAAAQGITIGPDGIRVQDPRQEQGNRRGERSERRGVEEISEREAVRAAKGEGVREVDRVRRTKSAYRVEGTDRQGDDIEVTVDRRSGEVLSVD